MPFLVLPTLRPRFDAGVNYYSIVNNSESVNKGLELEWCKSADAGLPAPDLLVHLQLVEAEAKERGGFGIERYEVVEFQEKVKLQVSP